MKLTKLGKVIVTLIVMVFSAFIYSKTGVFGELAQDNLFFQILTLISWAWLILGQFLIYCLLWED